MNGAANGTNRPETPTTRNAGMARPNEDNSSISNNRVINNQRRAFIPDYAKNIVGGGGIGSSNSTSPPLKPLAGAGGAQPFNLYGGSEIPSYTAGALEINRQTISRSQLGGQAAMQRPTYFNNNNNGISSNGSPVLQGLNTI